MVTDSSSRTSRAFRLLKKALLGHDVASLERDSDFDREFFREVLPCIEKPWTRRVHIRVNHSSTVEELLKEFEKSKNEPLDRGLDVDGHPCCKGSSEDTGVRGGLRQSSVNNCEVIVTGEGQAINRVIHLLSALQSRGWTIVKTHVFLVTTPEASSLAVDVGIRTVLAFDTSKLRGPCDERSESYECMETQLPRTLRFKIAKGQESPKIWQHLTPSYVLLRRKRLSKIPLSDIFSHKVNNGVDNTGNIRVWPTSIVMARYCCMNSQLFDNKRICELGSGMCGIVGLTIALSSKAAFVQITDGNPRAIENVRECINLNAEEGLLSSGHSVNAKTLLWKNDLCDGEVKAMGGPFDVIVASDILFFSNFHGELISTIWKLLKSDGVAILMQPMRKKTLSDFRCLAAEKFSVNFLPDFDPEVVWLHNQYQRDIRYDEDIHRPTLLRLEKPQNEDM